MAAIALIAFGLPSTTHAEEVCHLPGSGTPITIDVSLEDIADHLAHGDWLGPCYPPQVEVPYTCSSSTIFYEKLFVRSGARPPMSGTVDKPFSSVSAALDYAERKRLGAVEIQIAPGSYDPDAASITRPTRIVGPGRDAAVTAELALSIDHRSTHELGIQGVVFKPNGLEPGLTVRTDATAHDPRGHTAICNVGYDQIVGHAVAQVGGSISASDVVVVDTRRHPDAGFLNALTGTAFIFGGGLSGDIDALLEDSFVFESAGSGIVASGFAASVTLDTVAISGSRGCIGALYVGNAAELIGTHVRIGGVRSPDDPLAIEGLDSFAGQPIELNGNRLYGVYARGTTVLAGDDTLVGIHDLVIRNTLLDGNEAAECGVGDASSLAALRGADVVVDQFVLDASASLGVLVGEFGSTINLLNGIVSNNPLALSIQDPDYDLTTLTDTTVEYRDNDVNLDIDIVPVPEPEADLGSL